MKQPMLAGFVGLMKGIIMSSRNNLLQIVIGDYYLTIAWYKDAHWGRIHLGKYRVSYNFGKLSFILEKYHETK